MKKLVLVLLVAMLSVPAFAAPVIDLVDLGSRTVALDYKNVPVTDTNLISGMGIKITITGGTVATFTNGATKYWVHPENIVILDGAVSQIGSPVYEGNAVGLSTFTVEYGALYDRSASPADPNKPAASGRLCTFTVSGTGNYSVTATSDTVQGGVVTENLVAYTALTDTFSVTAALCPGDVTGTITGLVTGPPPANLKTFNSNLWTGPNGRTDTTDVQSLIYMLQYNGVALVVTPVPVKAIAGDVTGTITGLVTGPPPANLKTFNKNLWTGANGRLDTTDVQSLIYLLVYNGTSLVYTCPQ